MGSYKGWFLGALIGLCFSAALPAAEGQPQAARLSAAQVIDKHVAARGACGAWHRVQSMAWNGKMDVGFGDSAARSARYVSNAALDHSPTKRDGSRRCRPRQNRGRRRSRSRCRSCSR